MWVYDADASAATEVTVAEAAAGLARYARRLGPGTPACGVYEPRAIELMEGAAGDAQQNRDPGE